MRQINLAEFEHPIQFGEAVVTVLKIGFVGFVIYQFFDIAKEINDQIEILGPIDEEKFRYNSIPDPKNDGKWLMIIEERSDKQYLLQKQRKESMTKDQDWLTEAMNKKIDDEENYDGPKEKIWID